MTPLAPSNTADRGAEQYDEPGTSLPSGWRGARLRIAESRLGRRLAQAAQMLSAPRELALRHTAARDLLRRVEPSIHVDPWRGFVLIPRPQVIRVDGRTNGAGGSPNESGALATRARAPAAIAHLDEVLAHCRREIDAIRPDLDAIHATLAGKARLTIDLIHDGLLERAPEFLAFMLQDDIILPVIEYFGTVPFLSRIAMPHSIHMPELRVPRFHQCFHVDNDDFSHLKLFINVVDVGPDEGPLSFLPADVSTRVLRGLRREGKRVGLHTTFSDDEVFAHCDRSEVVRLVGPPGTALFVDPSRCLHHGSRVARGHERIVFGGIFLRYHRIHVNQSTQFAPQSGLDAVRTLLLRHPRRYPSGYFCPDPRLALRTSAVHAQ